LSSLTKCPHCQGKITLADGSDEKSVAAQEETIAAWVELELAAIAQRSGEEGADEQLSKANHRLLRAMDDQSTAQLRAMNDQLTAQLGYEMVLVEDAEKRARVEEGEEAEEAEEAVEKPPPGNFSQVSRGLCWVISSLLLHPRVHPHTCPQ
jgi:hypothetical protein